MGPALEPGRKPCVFAGILRTGAAVVPGDEDKLRMLLLAYVLHQVMDELGRELRSRSDNVRAPLQAIINLTEEQLPVRAPALETKADPDKPKS